MKPQKREQTIQILIEAAKQIVHEEGHGAITVRKVAEKTGYSYPILYHYFKDLNDLLWKLRFEMIEDMIRELTEPISKEPVEVHVEIQDENQSHKPISKPVGELITVFKRYANYFFENPNVFRFFYFHPFAKPENSLEYDQLEQRFSTLWENTFAGLIQIGLLSPSDIATFAKTIIYSLQGMIMLSLSANGTLTQSDIEKELDIQIAFLLRT